MNSPVRTCLILLIVLCAADRSWAQTCVVMRGTKGFTFPTIQEAVDAELSSRHITIHGACHENVRVASVEDMVIEGLSGATLTGVPGPAGGVQGVLFVSNAVNFQLKNLTITGTPDRAHTIVFIASSGTVEGVTVLGAPQNGINVQDRSSVTVRDSRVENNGANGVSVALLSSLNIRDTTISQNVANGVTVGSTGVVMIQGSTITQNGGNGLFVNVSGTANLSGDDSTTSGTVEHNEIAHNQAGGIGVSGGNLSGIGGHRIHHNGLSGIRVIGGGTALLSGQSTNHRFVIHDNGASGLSMLGSSGGLSGFVTVRNNNQSPPSPATPPFNERCGVCVEAGANFFAIDTQILSNAGYGLHLGRHSFANVRSVEIIEAPASAIAIELASGLEFISASSGPPGTPTTISGGVTCGDQLSWITGDLTGVDRHKCVPLR